MRWGKRAVAVIVAVSAVRFVACVGSDPSSGAGAAAPDAGGTNAPEDSSVDAAAAPAARLELSDLSLEFGLVDVGATLRKSLVVTNRSPDVRTVTTTFRGSSEFRVSNDGCTNVALAPDAKCPLELELLPTSHGAKTATLDFSIEGTLVAKATARGAGRDTVTVDVSVGGPVGTGGSVAGGAIDCGATCSTTIERGATTPELVLTALPDSSSVFGAWTGACSGVTSATCAVPLDAAASGALVEVGVVFALRKQLSFTLEGGADTSLEVTSTPPGVTCTGGACSTSGLFAAGTSVTLNAASKGAQPDVFRFVGCPDADKTKCTVVMDADRSVRLVATHYNIAFVSSERYTGALGGLDGADQICRDLAASKDLPGNFRAWLSTSTVNAPDRLPAGGLVRVDGAVLATEKSKVAKRMLHPLWLDEGGVKHIEDLTGEKVWTGTNEDGQVAAAHCDGWTNVASSGHTGVTQGATDAWTSYFAVSCAESHRLYCFADDLATVVSLPPLGAKRAVFVSKGTVVASAGTGPMDALCMTEAGSVGLAGNFVALVAENASTPAANRVSASGAPWARVDGVSIAPSASEFLSQGFEVTIDLHADNTIANTEVFTGYRLAAYTPRTLAEQPQLALDGTCAGWMSGASGTYAGVAQTAYAGYRSTGAYFGTGGDPACDQPKRIYCIQQ